MKKEKQSKEVPQVPRPGTHLVLVVEAEHKSQVSQDPEPVLLVSESHLIPISK